MRPVFKLLQTGSAAAAGAPRFKSQDRDDDRDERKPVQREARRRAELVERDARENGSDDAREVELDRVQRDGVREVLAVHERRHERLVGGPAEGLREADDEGQRQDHPDLDVVRGDQAREEKRRRELDELGGQKDPAPVEPVRENAAEQREEKKRSGAQKRVEREKRRGTRHREDQPGLRHLLHPGADARREGARPQEAVVAVRERLERPVQGHEPGRGREAHSAVSGGRSERVGLGDLFPAQFSGGDGVFSISPVIGTKRTGMMSFSVIFPFASFLKTLSSWKKPPTGMTIRPFGAS